MRAYIIRRLLLVVPTMLLVSLLVFFPIRFLPGDVMQLMVAEHTTAFYQAGITYTAWWPWLEEYNAERTLLKGPGQIMAHIWLDQDLREEVTGKR